MKLWDKYKDWRTDYWPEWAAFDKEMIDLALREQKPTLMEFRHFSNAVTTDMTLHPHRFKRADLEKMKELARGIVEAGW